MPFIFDGLFNTIDCAKLIPHMHTDLNQMILIEYNNN